MSSQNIWKVEDPDGAEYLRAILDFQLQEFIRIFGTNIMFGEPCTVYNDSQATVPMLLLNRNPISIRLAQPSLAYWAQTVFQLSHELCHYALRQTKRNKSYTLSWFEEIVCEAMSLYMLHWSSENWSECKLYHENSSFSLSLNNYLSDKLKMNGTDSFQRCTTIEALKEYESNFTTERQTHRNERNLIYAEILRNPLDCKYLCEYQRHVNEDGVTIDFNNWNNESQLIKALYSIQPCKSVSNISQKN